MFSGSDSYSTADASPHPLHWRSLVLPMFLIVVLVALAYFVGGTGRSGVAGMVSRLLITSAAALIGIGAAVGLRALLESRRAHAESHTPLLDYLPTMAVTPHFALQQRDVAHEPRRDDVPEGAPEPRFEPVRAAHDSAWAQRIVHPQFAPTDALEALLRRQRREINHVGSVLESMPDGVVVRAPDGQILFLNEAARVLLGDTSPTSGAEAIRAAAEQDTESLGTPLTPDLYALGETRQIETDSQIFHAQTAALVSDHDSAHERVGTVTLLRDVTEAVRRERTQVTILRQLDMSEPVIVGNDVPGRTSDTHPTAALASNSRLRDTFPHDRDAREPMAQFAREMRRNAVTLQKLIADMREITGGSANLPAQRSVQPILLETLVWSVANEWRQIARAADIRLDVLIEARGLSILGDERRLRWAIGNLIDNAIKYTAAGGACSIEIKGNEDGSHAVSLADAPARVLLRVRDNGTGIAPEEMPRIFDRFYRGTPRTAEGEAVIVPGTGQGLTIARQIIEAHQGRIRVKSHPGVGTAVYFSLPMIAARRTEAADVDDGLPRLPFDADDTLAGNTHSVRGTPSLLADDLEGETESLH